MVDGLLAEYGRWDVLVNNVAVASTKPFNEITEADFDLSVAVNVKGVFLGLLALPAGSMLRFAAGASIGSGLLAAAGVGAGSLIRHQVGAIIAMFTWTFVIELTIGGTAGPVGAFLPYTAAAIMAEVASGGGMPQVPRGVDPLPFAAATSVLCGVAMLLSVVAALTTARRDVSLSRFDRAFGESPDCRALPTRMKRNYSEIAWQGCSAEVCPRRLRHTVRGT